MRSGAVRTAKAFRGIRLLAVLLCVLPLLAGCEERVAPRNDTAVTAPPTLTPLPTVPPTASLAERLHLRTIAPNALTLIIQPDDGRAPVLDALNNARTSIDLMIYLMSDTDVIVALKNAVLRGVAVRVLLEQYPCCSTNNAAQRALFSDLQEARVQVQWANPAFRLTHAKMAVIDGASALVMAQNLTKTSFTFNREADVIDRDPTDVAALASLFTADWNRSRSVPTDPNLVIAPANARQKLLALINGAAKSLDIESEEMQDAGIEAALIAARKRGVALRYISSPPHAGPGTPQQPDENSAGRKRLIAGGVSIRLVAAPYMHTKTIVADGTVAFVGSENFSASSLDSSREIGLLMTDPSVIGRLASVFTKDWNAGKPET